MSRRVSPTHEKGRGKGELGEGWRERGGFLGAFGCIWGGTALRALHLLPASFLSFFFPPFPFFLTSSLPPFFSPPFSLYEGSSHYGRAGQQQRFASARFSWPFPSVKGF